MNLQISTKTYDKIKSVLTKEKVAIFYDDLPNPEKHNNETWKVLETTNRLFFFKRYAGSYISSHGIWQRLIYRNM